jgi:TonB-dependent SusC/RagA subfamily outer membrane receptor
MVVHLPAVKCLLTTDIKFNLKFKQFEFMKKSNKSGILHRILQTKVFRMMKLTAFFFFISTFGLIAAATYSQNKTVTINRENALIKDVLQEIEDQIGYFFIYNNEFVDVYRRISIHAEDRKINELLDEIFRGQDVAYSINERRIILSSSGKSDILQQQRSVSGKVTDASGNPIPGVTVVVKGTTVGTITSANGTYSLANVSADATLVFSFVGMRTQEVPVAGRMDFSIIMEEDLIGIEEVVAVGYGTVKKSDLTGSVSRVTNERMRELAATQITESLSGTVAGLYTTQNSSASGGGSMEIRGPSSISAISEPLIVLDGAIYSGSLSDINPADIETIDILKDASSAAIFGSRAAAGVIIATTKRGLQGKPVINFSARVGLSGTTNDFYPYGMDPDGDPMEYFNMHRDNLYQRSNGSLPYYYYWRPEDLPQDLDLSEWLGYVDNPHADPLTEWFNRMGVWPIERENYLAGKTTNFYDLVIGTGLRQDYNLSVSGATDRKSVV